MILHFFVLLQISPVGEKGEKGFLAKYAKYRQVRQEETPRRNPKKKPQARSFVPARLSVLGFLGFLGVLGGTWRTWRESFFLDVPGTLGEKGRPPMPRARGTMRTWKLILT